MSKQELVEINPFNEEMAKKVKLYDQENGTSYYNCIEYVKNTIKDSAQYEIYKMTVPVTNDIFAYYDGKNLSKLCSTTQQKDLKIFTMYLDDKNYNLHDDLEMYATKNLGMIVVVAMVDKNNNKLKYDLMDDNYTPYSDDDSKEKLIPLIKDKEQILKENKR